MFEHFSGDRIEQNARSRDAAAMLAMWRDGVGPGDFLSRAIALATDEPVNGRLARADAALYQAKRFGRNRVSVGQAA